MRITRQTQARGAISLVAMIDVLMILLVFFMVTSTYLDLDMVPLAGADPGADSVAPVSDLSALSDKLLIRLGGDGAVHVQGRTLGPAALDALVTARLAANPALQVLVLPSGQAEVQALATLMDTLVGAGASRLRIVRLEATP